MISPLALLWKKKGRGFFIDSSSPLPTDVGFFIEKPLKFWCFYLLDFSMFFCPFRCFLYNFFNVFIFHHYSIISSLPAIGWLAQIELECPFIWIHQTRTVISIPGLFAYQVWFTQLFVFLSLTNIIVVSYRFVFNWHISDDSFNNCWDLREFWFFSGFFFTSLSLAVLLQLIPRKFSTMQFYKSLSSCNIPSCRRKAPSHFSFPIYIVEVGVEPERYWRKQKWVRREGSRKIMKRNRGISQVINQETLQGKNGFFFSFSI